MSPVTRAGHRRRALRGVESKRRRSDADVERHPELIEKRVLVDVVVSFAVGW
jgi:hypothetical protein